MPTTALSLSALLVFLCLASLCNAACSTVYCRNSTDHCGGFVWPHFPPPKHPDPNKIIHPHHSINITLQFYLCLRIKMCKFLIALFENSTCKSTQKSSICTGGSYLSITWLRNSQIAKKKKPRHKMSRSHSDLPQHASRLCAVYPGF